MMSSSRAVAMIPVTLVYPVLKTATQLSFAVLVHLVSQATEKIAKVTFALCLRNELSEWTNIIRM